MSERLVKVFEVRSPDILKDNTIISKVAYAMIEAGLIALSKTGNAADLLSDLFPSNTKIGIKVNALAGLRMSSSIPLVYALADILNQSGHSKEDIVIWDRKERELKKAGYKLNTSGSGYRCFATDTRGAGYSRELYNSKSIGSLVSNIQANMTDATINFPVLKDHSLAGLSGCLKNYYGVIHNPNKYHENLCDPYQADLYALDVIGGKEKLAIFDAVRVQYNGGPGYMGQWIEEYKSILMSTDGVALDTIGIEIINRLRTKNGLRRLKESNREPVGIQTAGKAGLGCAEIDSIEWIVIEV